MISTFIGDPKDCGFARRLVRIYREKRRPQPVKEYGRRGALSPEYGMWALYRRMSRRAAFQIAWHQARNARGV